MIAARTARRTLGPAAGEPGGAMGILRSAAIEAPGLDDRPDPVEADPPV